MIPEKQNHKNTANIKEEKENVGVFPFFDPVYFIRRIFKNSYWFVIMGVLGYTISYVYSRWYAQRVYASNILLSISKNTSSYFAPNQSINFIWGQSGNQEGLYLKKILLSRSHNEYLVRELGLFDNYSTKGVIKSTYLDREDSPVYLEIDRDHLQQVNYTITLLPKGDGKYEVQLPEEGHSSRLYSYKTETFEDISAFSRPENRIISVGQWYETPNLKFRLVNNPNGGIQVDNIMVTLSTVNDAVNRIIGTVDVTFDKELSTIMIITKKGYNLNGTVNFLNTTIEKLIEKRELDNRILDRNTSEFVDKQLKKIGAKLDSAGAALNDIKVSEKLFDIANKDVNALKLITDLESKKGEILARIESLNEVNRVVESARPDNMINPETAGISDGVFNANISELKALYEKKRELAKIYTPESGPIQEVNRLIRTAKEMSRAGVSRYYKAYQSEIAKINNEIREAEQSLQNLPEKQRRYLDAERGYKVIESAYESLLSKKNEIQIRIASAQGGNNNNLYIIDSAKNLGQGPIAPDVNKTKMIIIMGLLFIPLLVLLIVEIFDNKIRNIRELLSVSKIPLLGVIGSNNHHSNLTVIEQSKSSVSESFRGVRANMRFLYSEDGKGKSILVTSSIGGEGKTYNSINIASVLALSGKKTILMGMDLRKPKIFEDFNINNREGLSNYLAGEVDFSQIVSTTQIPTLDVVTSGPIPPNPSELLMSQRNIDLIENLKNEYDFVVIDSPPVGLVADSFELMKHTDANVYIVRHEYTEKYMVRMIIEKYHNNEVQHLGLVYNDYNTQQGYGYGYGYFDEDKNYKEPFLVKLRNKIRQVFSKN